MAEDIIVNFLTKKNEASDAFDDIDDGAKGAEKSVGKTSLAMRGLKGAALFGAGAAALAIAGIGTAALNVSLDTKNAATSMSASLGIPIEKAEEFAQVAQDVYRNNFGESVTEAASVVEMLGRQIESLAGDNNGMQAAAEDAFALRDVFDIDLADSVDAVDTLMENFGITSEQAFDLITAGTQKGLNRSGDFLDTIGEYSTQFANGGATADEFFQFLESGLQGGVLGTDKAADAFKEFRLRIVDGTDATKEATTALLGSEEAADKFFQGLDDGSLSSKDAFNLIVGKIGETESASDRMALGTALLGTQFEDLGDTAVRELSFMGESFANVENASESLNRKYETFGDLASGISRRVIVAITPLTDKLLDIANRAMPHVEAAFTVFETKFIPTIERVGGMISWATDLIRNMFSGSEFSEGITSNLAILDTLSDWFDVNLPLMKQAVEVITKAMGEFWSNHGENIMTVLKNTFSVITTVIDVALKTILGAVTLILAAITGDWQLFGDTLKNMGRAIFRGLADVVKAQLSSLGAIFDSAFVHLPDKVASGFNAAKNAFTLGARTVTSGIKTVFNGQSLQEAADLAIAGLTTGLNFAFDRLAPHTQALASNLTTKIKEGFSRNGLRGAADGAISGFIDAINFKFDGLIPHISSVLETMVLRFSEIFSWDTMRGIAHRAMDGLLGGLDEKFNAIRDKMSSISNMMPDTIKNILGMQSPSKVFERIRDDILSPLENMSPEGVTVAAQGIANGLVSPFGNTGQQTQQTVDSSRSNTNIFQVTLQVTGDTVEQAGQAIDELAFRYGANLASA